MQEDVGALAGHAGSHVPFPLDLDVDRQRLRIGMVSREDVKRHAFLDQRFGLDRPDAFDRPIAPGPSVSGPLGWLFHTSFCGSTLLARLLEAPIRIVLREPLVIRRLADAHELGKPISALVPSVIGGLSEPWRSDVVIKPTHAALNVAPLLMRCSPMSKAIVLTSSLEDFLVSNIKKTEETQAKVPLLVRRAFRGSVLRYRLKPSALRPPSWLGLVGLQWAAQRELVVDLLQENPRRAASWDAGQLMEDPLAVTRAVLEWLDFREPEAETRARVAQVANVHAKACSRTYTATHREHEMRIIADEYREPLNSALAWLEDTVLPHLRPEALSLAPAWGRA